MVADTVRDVEVEFAEGAGADPRSYRVDFSKIAESLGGFRPVLDGARTGMPTTRRSLSSSAHMDDVMFSSDRFVRLARLKTLLGDGKLDAELRWRAPIATQA